MNGQILDEWLDENNLVCMNNGKQDYMLLQEIKPVLTFVLNTIASTCE